MSDRDTSRGLRAAKTVLSAEKQTSRSGEIDHPLVRHLAYQSPFDWEAVLAAFRAHQLPHLESVDDKAYERVTKTSVGDGWFRVERDQTSQTLKLSVWRGTDEDLKEIETQVRRMFDLDADPTVIKKAFAGDQYLSTVWKKYPGLRVARSWNGFETMLTTILGQLVSVSFGRILTDELMTAAGAKIRHPKTGESIHLFPTPRRILGADLSTIRTSEARRTALRHLAELIANRTLEFNRPLPPKELRKVLLSAPGVGAWTSEYIAMRGFHDDDAFPGTDYGLKQELKRHPEVDVNRVRPWRAYAATALWRSFAESKGTSYESVV